jgi:hypothetical protein
MTAAMADGGDCPTVASLVKDKRITGDGKDPWGNAYTIDCGEEELTVTSNGPDGKAGSADDIRSDPKICKR